MRKDPTQFRERFKQWKLGEKPYEAGRPVKYDEGTGDEDPNSGPTMLPKYEYEIDVTPRGVSALKHERVPEANWLNYWDNAGKGYFGNAGKKIYDIFRHTLEEDLKSILDVPAQVQMNPGVATTYNTFGQYVPRLKSTTGDELDYLMNAVTAPEDILRLVSLIRPAIGNIKNLHRVVKLSKAINKTVNTGINTEKYGLSNFNKDVLTEDGFLGKGRLIHTGTELITSDGIYAYPKINMRQKLPGELRYTQEPNNIWWTNNGNVYGGRSANNSTIISVNRDAVEATEALTGKPYVTTKGFMFTPKMDVKVTSANPFTRLLQPQSHIRYVK